MTEASEVLVGFPAKDVTLERGDGETILLSELWKDSLIVAVFMRHLG